MREPTEIGRVPVGKEPSPNRVGAEGVGRGSGGKAGKRVQRRSGLRVPLGFGTCDASALFHPSRPSLLGPTPRSGPRKSPACNLTASGPPSSSCCAAQHYAYPLGGEGLYLLLDERGNFR